MKRNYWKTGRHSGGAFRKSSKTTQISPLSSAAISTIDRYSEELKNMPDDKNAPIEFFRNCPADQIENMKAAQLTTKRKIMEDFVRKNFREIPRSDIRISPNDPLFSHRNDQQAIEAHHVKANFLSDAGRRDLIKTQAKMAAENRKLRDKYFDMLRHVIVEMPFESFSYQLACVFFPISADDFTIAEYLNGVKLYLLNTQVTLRVNPADNPFQEEPEFFFTEDQLLSWIDEIESSIEVTESAASYPPNLWILGAYVSSGLEGRVALQATGGRSCGCGFELPESYK